MQKEQFELLLDVLKVLDRNRASARTALDIIDSYSPEMTQEQKAALLETFVKLSRNVNLEQKLEEFERKQYLKGPGYL